MRGKFFIFLGCLGIVFFLVGHIAFSSGKEGIEVPFQIKRGESAAKVSSNLEDKGLIGSEVFFTLYTVIRGKALSLEPGVYALNGGMEHDEILKNITERGKNEVLIVIPEGYSIKDIQHILQKKGVLVDDELYQIPIESFSTEKFPFLNGVESLEGFLFPDTYRFEREITSYEVAEHMLENFNEKAWPLLAKRKNWYKTLILASMLEGEVVSKRDQALVAGILTKRERVGMRLQVDATVGYAKCDGRVRTCDEFQIIRKDIEIDSPINTYQNSGFPPQPISNPGERSIESALNPVGSSYWYYLSEPKNGRTLFSTNLEEHNEKRAIYLGL